MVQLSPNWLRIVLRKLMFPAMIEPWSPSSETLFFFFTYTPCDTTTTTHHSTTFLSIWFELDSTWDNFLDLQYFFIIFARPWYWISIVLLFFFLHPYIRNSRFLILLVSFLFFDHGFYWHFTNETFYVIVTMSIYYCNNLVGLSIHACPGPVFEKKSDYCRLCQCHNPSLTTHNL